MANLAFQFALAQNPAFQSRVFAQLMNSSISIFNETADEVQSVAITGSPTGGSAVLSTLPGQATTMTGTLANAANTVTGLQSTAALAVGMSVTGTNVAANATIATITSTTALTLSANSTASGAQSLTFVGGGAVSVPSNCTAANLQALLGNLASIGNGNVVCTGGPLPGAAISVTFTNNLGGLPLALVTAGTNGLTGGASPALSLSRTTAGVAVAYHTARLAQAKKNLIGSFDILRYSVAIAGNATVQGDFDTSFSPTVSEAQLATDIGNAVSANWNAFD